MPDPTELRDTLNAAREKERAGIAEPPRVGGEPPKEPTTEVPTPALVEAEEDLLTQAEQLRSKATQDAAQARHSLAQAAKQDIEEFKQQRLEQLARELDELDGAAKSPGSSKKGKTFLERLRKDEADKDPFIKRWLSKLGEMKDRHLRPFFLGAVAAFVTGAVFYILVFMLTRAVGASEDGFLATLVGWAAVVIGLVAGAVTYQTLLSPPGAS